MPFEMLTRVGPRNHVKVGRGDKVAMRSFVKIIWQFIVVVVIIIIIIIIIIYFRCR